MEVMAREDRENLQKQLPLLKKKRKAKRPESTSGLFYWWYLKFYFPPKIFPRILPSPPPSFF